MQCMALKLQAGQLLLHALLCSALHAPLSSALLSSAHLFLPTWDLQSPGALLDGPTGDGGTADSQHLRAP